MKYTVTPRLAAILLIAFSPLSNAGPIAHSELADTIKEKPRLVNKLDNIAAHYVVLELSMARHDANHVDAYFGPADLKEYAENNELSIDEIQNQMLELGAELAEVGGKLRSPLMLNRAVGIKKRLEAALTRTAINKEVYPPFDQETEYLFDAKAPSHDASQFQAVLDQIDVLLPGDGLLVDRVNAFRDQFVIPSEKLEAVFNAAIEECRRRTLKHIDLPANESFRVEYVTDKPWSGYNWYQGDAQSLIQINTDLPIYIDRAVDLGCHEGYPGHHTYNALLEDKLVKERGWIEFSLYPLFSPQSLIAEGSANHGIELAFPSDERVEFEKSTLFPLAGLDPESGDKYYRLLDLLSKLTYVGNEVARGYLNGSMTREHAIDWFMHYSLNSRDRAEQRLRFIDTYRSYVINYNLGRDLVRTWVECGTSERDQHWRKFTRLLSSAMIASNLGCDKAE